jgi:hypothetical protein
MLLLELLGVCRMEQEWQRSACKEAQQGLGVNNTSLWLHTNDSSWQPSALLPARRQPGMHCSTSLMMPIAAAALAGTHYTAAAFTLDCKAKSSCHYVTSYLTVVAAAAAAVLTVAAFAAAVCSWARGLL